MTHVLFVGRKQVVNQLLAAFSYRRNVVISGPEGIGKSLLLRKVAEIQPLLYYCDISKAFSELADDDLSRNPRLQELCNRITRAIDRGCTIALDHTDRAAPNVIPTIAATLAGRPFWVDACEVNSAFVPSKKLPACPENLDVCADVDQIACSKPPKPIGWYGS